jgi:hypothetical protein
MRIPEIKAELDTYKAVAEERGLEILGRVKRLEMVLIGSAGTTIVLLLSLVIKG